MREEALLIGPAQSNVGVFTPATGSADGHAKVAVICLTAGLLHHVGPHRMHVILARALTKVGVSTLRFDMSGIGDSAVRTDDLPAHEAPVADINDAIHELENRGYTRFILFGICSGALYALQAAVGNSKIAGIILVNAGTIEGNSEASTQAAAQYYLKRSLWNLTAWKNLITGKVKYRALVTTLFLALVQKFNGKSIKTSSSEQDSLGAIQLFTQQGTSILVVLSDRHAQLYALKEKVYKTLQSRQFKTLVYPETDHLFCSVKLQQDLIDQICLWAGDLVNQNV